MAFATGNNCCARRNFLSGEEVIGVAIYMGRGSSLISAISAIKVFDEFADTPKI